MLPSFKEAFASGDWHCQPDFLAPARVAALRQECLMLERTGCFRPAGVGRQAVQDAAIRGDKIFWLEEGLGQTPEALRLLRNELDELRGAINAGTFLGLLDFEGHYASYPPGTGYARHVDRFRDDHRRVVSLVLYLNDRWQAEDGGELLLYANDDTAAAARIRPVGGTLVYFLSERVPHEVRPARRARLSLTGWFRRGG